MSIRERIYNVIRPDAKDSRLERWYDGIMLIAICASIVPLWFKRDLEIFVVTEKITVTVFIIDYIARWITADMRFKDMGALAFIRYPFTLGAIVDLLSILPGLAVMYDGFKVFRLTRLPGALKLIRVFKTFRYSKYIHIIIKVVNKEKEHLLVVLGFTLAYIVMSATFMFRVEPDTFDHFFDAVYWSTITLTTIGYGDVIPVTDLGKAVTIISSLMGIMVLALPAGFITAGYLDELQNEKTSE